VSIIYPSDYFLLQNKPDMVFFSGVKGLEIVRATAEIVSVLVWYVLITVLFAGWMLASGVE